MTDSSIALAEPRMITNALSPRESAILELIAQGQSNKATARILGISPETVKTHVKNLFVKLRVETRAQAVARAHSRGFLNTALVADRSAD